MEYRFLVRNRIRKASLGFYDQRSYGWQMEVYDLNEQLANRREQLALELKQQIDQIDRRIETLQEERSRVSDARQTLYQLEAVLRRMSMLAREVKGGKRRPKLYEEFETCKREVEALSRRAQLYGVNLVHSRAESVVALVDDLMAQLPGHGENRK